MHGATRNPSARRPFPRGGPTTAALAFLALAAAVLLFTLVDPREPMIGLLAGGADLDVYRDGARHVMEGLPLYTEPVIHGLFYTYTPFSTLMFIPFGLLPGGIDKYIWMGANVSCWLRSLRYAGRYWVPGSPRTSWVSRHCWRWPACSSNRSHDAVLRPDQPGPDGAGAVGRVARREQLAQGGRCRYRRRDQADAGVLRPLLPGAAAVAGRGGRRGHLRRDRREVGWSSRRIRGSTGPRRSSIPRRIARRRASREPVVARRDHAPGGGARADGAVAAVLAAAVVAVSMWVVVRLHRGGERLLAVTVAGLTAAVVSPFTWSHHWVWFVPLLVYLVHRALTNAWWWLRA